MINSTLCYITRGDEVLMLHRVKKKNILYCKNTILVSLFQKELLY